MKVLIVTHYFQPHVGGIEIVALNHAREFIKRGDSVTVITSKLQREDTFAVLDKIKLIRVKAINFLESMFQVPYPIFSPALISVLKKEIIGSDLVIVHGAIYQGSLIASIISWVYKKRVVTIEHVGFVYYNKKVLNLIENLAFRTIGKIVFFLSSKILVLNSNVYNYVTQLTNTKVEFIKNGVDTDLFHPISDQKKVAIRKKLKLPLNRPIVLFVGRFVQKKGINLVLNNTKMDCDLVLVGSGELKISLPKEGVYVFKNVDQKKLAEIYQACDIFLLPSKDEGFPLSVLEAMSSGLPLVISGADYAVDFDKNLTKIIQPKNNEIEVAVNSILNDNLLRHEMGSYSRNLALNKFSWKESIRNILP